MKILPIFLFLTFLISNSFAQKCLQAAKTVPPIISKETRTLYLTKLSEAKAAYEKNPDAENLIWLGRRTAYAGDYLEAIKIFTKGIEQFPDDARFYRHRGHRFITIRCFKEAIKDLEKAAKLIKGKEDEIEPDGLPNAKNIPTSTLQTNIFYHLGLAYYLKGDFKKALRAYRECLKLSHNNDMAVAAINWIYMSLRRLKKDKEAEKIVAMVEDNLDLIENGDYYKLIKLYQGKLKTEDLLNLETDSLSNVSLAYGVGNWFLYNGKTDEAMKIFRQINLGNQWASFGFIAAEAELRR